MTIWQIILIILAICLVLTVIWSIFCFVVTNIRLKELNYYNPIIFKYTEYRYDKKRMIDAFNWYDKQKFKEYTLISRDGLKLTSFYLETKGADKIAILFHGYRGSARNDFSPMIPFYQSLGYNILIVNQRSHGKSKGRAITFGIKEKFDCVDWVNFSNKEFNNKETILVGISMGASTVLLASGQNLPKNVKTIIADCGYTSPYEIIKNTMKLIRMPIYPTIWYISFYYKIFCKGNLKTECVKQAVRKSKTPILFIHGTADRLVPFRMSQENFDATKVKKDILLVEGASHAGSYVQATKIYEEKVTKWLKELE